MNPSPQQSSGVSGISGVNGSFAEAFLRLRMKLRRIHHRLHPCSSATGYSAEVNKPRYHGFITHGIDPQSLRVDCQSSTVVRSQHSGPVTTCGNGTGNVVTGLVLVMEYESGYHERMRNLVFFPLLFGLAVIFFIFTVWADPRACTITSIHSVDVRGGGAQCFFDSPDETANYFWAKRIAEGGGWSYEEPLNGVARGLLKPRSFHVIGTRVVPGSFIGLALMFGTLARWLGVGVIPYLTPFFASLALIAFALLIRKLFGRSIGLVSAALLVFLPPWWYYSARGMYHNVLFVSLVMIGMSLLVHLVNGHSVIPVKLVLDPDRGTGIQKEQRKSIFIFFSGSRIKSGMTNWLRLLGWGVAGLLIGYSLVVRSSETGWVALLVISLSVGQFVSLWRRGVLRTFPWLGVLLFMVCGIFTLVPLFATNIELYGAPIAIGYHGGIGQEFDEFLRRLPSPEYRNLFFAPFGINFVQLKRTVNGFLIDFIPWWTWPMVAGAVFAFFRIMERIIKNIRNNDTPVVHDREIVGSAIYRYPIKNLAWYGVLYLGIGALLIVYYGSWEFTDRIDRRMISLNTSFLRYWLPVYVMGLPFISLCLFTLSAIFKKIRWMQFAAAGFAVVVFAYLSASLVLNDSDESLIAVQTRLQSVSAELTAVKEVAPEGAVLIIFPQADKTLFPSYRRLITALAIPEDYQAVVRLTRLVPVYYYTHVPPAAVESVVYPLFARYGLSLIEVRRVYAQRWLWRVVKQEGALARNSFY